MIKDAKGIANELVSSVRVEKLGDKVRRSNENINGDDSLEPATAKAVSLMPRLLVETENTAEIKVAGRIRSSLVVEEFVSRFETYLAGRQPPSLS